MTTDKIGAMDSMKMEGNSDAAAQGMPKELRQVAEAVSNGVNADSIVQACGSPQKACADLMKIAASGQVSDKTALKCMEMVNQISAASNLQGAVSSTQSANPTHNVQAVGMEGKDKGALV